jgi:hypothetical protein
MINMVAVMKGACNAIPPGTCDEALAEICSGLMNMVGGKKEGEMKKERKN